MLTKYELEQRCKHILDYGENWGFVHVRGEIQWREKWIRECPNELKKKEQELSKIKQSIKYLKKEKAEMKTELEAYKKLVSKMEEKRVLKKLVV